MMIRAYPETCLEHVKSMLGDAFDYAVNSCRIDGMTFSGMFLVSTFSRRIEKGDPACLGMSGIELAQSIILETSDRKEFPAPEENYSRNAEYWIGWALAWYQWYSDRSFQDIFEAVSYSDLMNMYHPLHEADLSKFAEVMDEKLRERFRETRLKEHRSNCRLTQEKLSERSGVSIRSIQMYEQRNKNINKAAAETLYRLAKVSGCSMESLLEKPLQPHDGARRL